MVQDIGAFVRVLLPIQLTGGFTMTVGTWLGVHPDDLKQAWEVWWKPEYLDLRLQGRLANAVPPWGEQVFGKPAFAVVRNPDQVPYIDGSTDHFLDKIVRDEWPHEAILPALDV
jgi:hypothetical protein